jgi:hypothetical protein
MAGLWPMMARHHGIPAMRQFPPRKLIYQRKSAKQAQLTVLTWHESIGQWGSQNFSTGTARKVSATLTQWVRHLDRTGQRFTLLQLDCRRQTLPAWQQIVADHNRRPWHT